MQKNNKQQKKINKLLHAQNTNLQVCTVHELISRQQDLYSSVQQDISSNPKNIYPIMSHQASFHYTGNNILRHILTTKKIIQYNTEKS